MSGLIALVYGVVAYGVFLVAILYAIGFIGGFWVLKTVNDGEVGGWVGSVVVDVLLLGMFAVQHTVMARPWFKERWVRVLPGAVERSTFVLAASLILCFTYWQWRPIEGVAWDFEGVVWRWLLWGQYAVGWVLVFVSSFLIDHFDLFGLRQVWLYFRGREYVPRPFMVRSLYRYVRHPLMFGFILVLWSPPTMTWGQVLFAGVATGYILVGIRFEERDLVRQLGEDYLAYRRVTPMLMPGPPSGES